QPWKFFIISNNDLRNKLLPHSWGQLQVTDCSHFVVLCARENMDDAEITRFLQSTADARAVEVATLDGYGQMMRGFVSQMDDAAKLNWAKHQVYIALGQLMTSAAVLGIDACPMEGIVPAEYDQLLNLEGSGFKTTVACALGYRSADDKYASLAKVRYPVEELVEFID
ncbi:MAG: NAD(P)H-dependent oxidoreductase, partial [Akkermansiaceae bacterium]